MPPDIAVQEDVNKGMGGGGEVEDVDGVANPECGGVAPQQQ